MGNSRGRAAAMAAAMAAAASLLGGCSTGHDLAQPTPGEPLASHCATVMATLPETLGGQSRVGVDRLVATWGDPAISVRCGVEKPAALEPTSRCDVINGVGWFAEEPGSPLRGAWRFTTIGRAGFIEVVVPERYEPAGDVLNELTTAVKKLPETKPCQ